MTVLAVVVIDTSAWSLIVRSWQGHVDVETADSQALVSGFSFPDRASLIGSVDNGQVWNPRSATSIMLVVRQETVERDVPRLDVEAGRVHRHIWSNRAALVEVAAHHQADWIVWPHSLAETLGEGFTELPKLVMQASYEERAFDIGTYSHFLPMSDARLEQLRGALKRHLSQVRRTPFDRIATLQAQEFREVLGAGAKGAAGVELYRHLQVDNGMFRYHAQADRLPTALDLDVRRLAIFSPHPDDAQIGMGAMIMDQAARPSAQTLVFDMTSGNHASVAAADVLEHPDPDPMLVQQVIGSPEAIQRPAFRTAVRHHESRTALGYLDPAAKLESLDLPFYDNGYEPTAQDVARIDEVLDQLLRPGSDGLVIAVPTPDDAHRCHRQTTALVLDRLARLSRTRKLAVHVLLYRTPWSGHANGFLIAGGGLKSVGLIAGERLGAKGAHGLQLVESLGLAGKGAFRAVISEPRRHKPSNN